MLVALRTPQRTLTAYICLVPHSAQMRISISTQQCARHPRSGTHAGKREGNGNGRRCHRPSALYLQLKCSPLARLACVSSSAPSVASSSTSVIASRRTGEKGEKGKLSCKDKPRIKLWMTPARPARVLRSSHRLLEWDKQVWNVQCLAKVFPDFSHFKRMFVQDKIESLKRSQQRGKT